MAAFPCKSPDCLHIYVQHPPGDQPTPFQGAVVALGGRIQGARVVNGNLQELFVQPGTSIGFALDSDEIPDFKLTETASRVGFSGLKGLPRAPERAPIIAGLTLRKGREVAGVLFSPAGMSTHATTGTARAESRRVGREESPTANRPYLEVLTGPLSNVGRAIELAGRGFEAGRILDIALDGQTTERVTVNQAGKFTAVVRAPMQFGLHSVTIVDTPGKKVVDGTFVVITPSDEPRPAKAIGR
jgi:hypothetical protein